MHSCPTGLVARFYEEPAAPLAERLFRHGAIWNTCVMVGSARRLWGLAHEHLPDHTQLCEPARQRLAVTAHHVRAVSAPGRGRQVARDMAGGSICTLCIR